MRMIVDAIRCITLASLAILNPTIRYLLFGYVGLYVFMAVGLFWSHAALVSEEEKTDPAWELPVDVLTTVLGLAGMLFLLVNAEIRWLQLLWRPVSFLLVAFHLWQTIRARNRAPANQDTRLADISTVIFLGPSLALNLVFAFR